MFNGAVQGILPRPVSDHFPILLEGGGLKRGPSPFRFENMWLEEEGFKDKLKTWWGSLKFTGSASYILDAKLRALKNILKIWNKEEFGLVEAKKGEALKQVEYWDEKEKYDVLNMEDCEARNGAREAYKMANAHCRRNWLSKLKVNGCWHSEENNLRNSVVGAFQELYQEEEGWRPSVDGISFMRLDISEAEGLEIPFVEEEVLAALTDLGKDKARGRMALQWRSGFMVPKKGGAEDLKDFRPISLVGSLYKLLAKVLANRIKKRRLLIMWLEVLVDFVKAMGFGERWIMWIEWCISTVRYSVLINGSPSGFFQSSRGFEARIRGRGGEGILISHLLFADDTLVFCEESQDQLTYLSWLLMWFEACSGIWVCLWGHLSNQRWYGIVLKRGLGKGWLCGRDSIFPRGKTHPYSEHSFQFSGLLHVSFPFAQKSKDAVEKIQRDFLWGGGALDQRPHLVRWNLVCLEKKKGGLGVRNLALMNKALLGKWNWRFATEREVLWKKVISHKYGVEEGAFRVGNGRRMRFWKDKWCGDEPLYESFPSLFAISQAKDAWVSEVWNPDGVGDGWTPLVQRENEDKMVWTTSKSGVFSVKSLYSILEPGGSAMFPYVGIWKASVPPKVAFFRVGSILGQNLNSRPTSEEGLFFGK
ncbi:putative ribonuclease H protein [Vitis vinifera]|uniref:Putative ribonuclease H protein n=1 Tax=Vitis vinifera TaxID=29760 RepID=A0A438HZ99_VITVI|nr:putative ribonuclease H protein [Vitis vinifera]